MGILPPDPVDLAWRRWGLGLVLPLLLAGWGIVSIVTRHAYLPGRRGNGLSLHGTAAVCLGISCLGFGLALFFSLFFEDSEALAGKEAWGMAAGLTVGTAGLAGMGWLVIAG